MLSQNTTHTTNKLLFCPQVSQWLYLGPDPIMRVRRAALFFLDRERGPNEGKSFQITIYYNNSEYRPTYWLVVLLWPGRRIENIYPRIEVRVSSTTHSRGAKGGGGHWVGLLDRNTKQRPTEDRIEKSTATQKEKRRCTSEFCHVTTIRRAILRDNVPLWLCGQPKEAIGASQKIKQGKRQISLDDNNSNQPGEGGGGATV